MQKSLINKTHRLSLPQQQKHKNGIPLRHKQQSSLFSYKKINKQITLQEESKPGDPQRVSLPNISFNLLKQKLAQYLQPTQSVYMSEAKNRYQQISNTSPSKTENYKIRMFRTYKKNKMLAEFSQNDQEITQLGKDFNIKEIEIKSRLSMHKQPTFLNMAVKRDCLRYFGQNKCFQKALKFRKNTPTLSKKQRIVELTKTKLQKQQIQASLQYSAEDIEKIKVQPWRQQKSDVEDREISQIEDLQ